MSDFCFLGITAIFSLLHRLRQACNHVALTVKAHLNEDDWNSNVIAQPSSEEVDSSPVGETKKSEGDAIDNQVSYPGKHFQMGFVWLDS